MKKFQCSNHIVMKLCMTRTTNNDSQGIYKLRVG